MGITQVLTGNNPSTYVLVIHEELRYLIFIG